jgi:sugar diacid utilization regulator
MNDRRELQLKVAAGGRAELADIEVSGLVVLEDQDPAKRSRHQAHPPGTLFLIDLGGNDVGGTASALGRLVITLAERRASGLVVAVPEHGPPPAFPAATLAAAARLGTPLLTTTARPSDWEHVNDYLARSRVEYAERQLERLAGLMRRLPMRWADPTALAGITKWLAASLDAHVVVSEPQRGVLASAPRSAQPSDPTPPSANPTGSPVGLHRRKVSLDPTREGEAVLEVASARPFDAADSRLIQHAAHLLGLVDQAQREFGTVHHSVHEAKSIIYQLLTHGEPDKARNLLKTIAPALAAAKEARVFVIDCGSQEQREETLRHRALAATGRSLVVPCPDEARHIVIVEPLLSDDVGDEDLLGQLQRLVARAGSHRLGGSRRRPLAALRAAHEEARTALQSGEHTDGCADLTLGRSSVVDLMDPIPAHAWARHLLVPLRALPPGQRSEMERTLSVALSHPRTMAARLLDVHRNTVAYRLHRAAELLRMDFDRIEQRVLVALALELAAQPPVNQGADYEETSAAVTLEDLLRGPRIRAWAEELLRPLCSDRRGLETTLMAWLEQQGHVERTARELGIADVTVRSHLKTVAQATGRDLGSTSGLRDLFIAVCVRTNSSLHSPSRDPGPVT